MKILQVCKKIPYPPKDGEAIAIYNLTTGFAKAGVQVHCLAITTPKHNYDISELPPALKENISWDTVYIDTSLSPFKALKNLLFSELPYVLERFQSEKVENKLKEILQKEAFDIIHLEGIFLVPYIPLIRKFSKAPIAMRAHNVESEIWQRVAAGESFFLKKWYLNSLSQRMAKLEKESVGAYDALIPISSKDEAQFLLWGYHGPKLVVPASIRTEDYLVDSSNEKEDAICFIGSLDWIPNLEGLDWFMEQVWPKVLLEKPNATFYVAGRNIADNWKKDHWKNIVVLGEVDDAHDFMRAHQVMIVPLFSGSGMRVKIIEAMALGKPLVCTALAAEGISYRDGHQLLIANDVDTFARHLIQLLSNKSKREELSKNARNFVEIAHNTDTLTDMLLMLYRSLKVNKNA